MTMEGKPSFKEITDDYPWDLLLEADPSQEMIQSYLERGQCIGTYLQGRLAGVFVLMTTRPRTMEIMNMAVYAQLRGQGLGREMIEEAKRRAVEDGCTMLEVGTANSSLRNLALYQRAGFRMIAVDKDHYLLHYDDALEEHGIAVMDMVRLRLML